jgi:hypothetical protein
MVTHPNVNPPNSHFYNLMAKLANEFLQFDGQADYSFCKNQGFRI